MQKKSKSVVFVNLNLSHYSAPFQIKVRKILASHNVKYDLIYAPPEGDSAKKQDTVDLQFATKLKSIKFKFLGIEIYWQPIYHLTRNYDLAIVVQENKRIVNYTLQLRYLLGGTNIAFYGHGKNFQSDAPGGLRERWKRFWLTKVHWWFAYTEGSARVVEEAGFPRGRITVFNNSIDTVAIRSEVESITPDEIETLRCALEISSDNVGIYVGGMYKEKRLDFLIEAALLIRERVADFHLLLVGGGIDAPIAERAAVAHDFIHFLGPKFGRDKTALAIMAKVFLMPGLVGLAVLDSLVYGLPMVTTNVSNHGPEIAYLEEGINGIISPDPEDVNAFAEAVAALLQDEDRRQALRAAALRSSEYYSIEDMAERSAKGILRALETK